METNVAGLVKKAKEVFPKSFINEQNELILEPKNNVYFRLEGLENEMDFKCKMISWMSRPIAKGLSPHWSKKMLICFNKVMGTNFTKAEMADIYTALGMDVNLELSVQFIESGYDLSLLAVENWQKEA